MMNDSCTANTIRPALQILKTAPGTSLVSSIFFMLLEDGVKVFGDCAINVSPTAEQLTEIAIASAKVHYPRLFQCKHFFGGWQFPIRSSADASCFICRFVVILSPLCQFNAFRRLSNSESTHVLLC
jgi:Phosphate acetyl/butaryl transferase